MNFLSRVVVSSMSVTAVYLLTILLSGIWLHSRTMSWITTTESPYGKLFSRKVDEREEHFQEVDPRNRISQDDIYLTIKTSENYHKTRLPLIFKTWWTAIKQQVYFFTDNDDEAIWYQTDGHLIVTGCGKTHAPFELCCKMGYEYDYYYDSKKKWWCHIDDDNYVNPSLLVKALNQYNWKKPFYVGRPSLEGVQYCQYKGQRVPLYFATGGAGVCISRRLSELMVPWMRNGSFVKTCKDLIQPDDVTLGFIATNRLGINLTHRYDFNSHIQNISEIPTEELLSQAVLSYSSNNVINLTDPVFPIEDDHSRLLSYHCKKYPQTGWCPKDRKLRQ